jgi:uncharacterized protein
MNERNIDVILIPSTLCNLRCSYCYELSVLADKRRMTLETLDHVFARLAEYFVARDIPSARLIWHGGEPLLLPPEFYWRAFDLQKRHFADLNTQVSNVVQTNLTVLDDARTELLRSGFDACGVSLDLFGSLRMDAAGNGREGVALANLEKLRAQGVIVGGVTVLTRANRFRVQRIFEFYRDRDMAFRILPLHAGDFASGQWFEISPSDTLRAFTQLADLWLADPAAPPIHPVVGVIRDVFRHHAGYSAPQYNRRAHEAMFAIDREGYVSAFEECHDRTKSYGSLLETSLEALLASSERARVGAEADERLRKVCGKCPHFQRTCTSYPMVEGARDYWDRDPAGEIVCTAFAGLIAHIEGRLRASGSASEIAEEMQRAVTFAEQGLAAKKSERQEEAWRLLA